MKITNIEIKKVEDHDKLKAFVKITLDDTIAIRDIKVIDGTNGLFMSMPSKKVNDGYMDIVFPISRNAREFIEGRVLEEYKKY